MDPRHGPLSDKSAPPPSQFAGYSPVVEPFGFVQATFWSRSSASLWIDVELVSAFTACVGTTRRRSYNGTGLVAEINGT